MKVSRSSKGGRREEACLLSFFLFLFSLLLLYNNVQKKSRNVEKGEFCKHIQELKLPCVVLSV